MHTLLNEVSVKLKVRTIGYTVINITRSFELYNSHTDFDFP